MREEENNKSSRRQDSSRKVVPMFKKRRWSAIYIGGIAVILAGAMVYQLAVGNSSDKTTPNSNRHNVSQNSTEETAPVTSTTEELKMPVANEDSVSVKRHFYDETGSDVEQQDALVYYDNQYTKNKGTDYVAPEGVAFDVVAALSGTVVKNEEDSLLGTVVEIQHDNGLKTIYQSLESVEVELGDTVKQGQVLGKSGQSVIGKDLGIHLHFEVRSENVAVNPETSYNKTIATLQDDLKKSVEEASSSSEEPKQSNTEEETLNETTPESETNG